MPLRYQFRNIEDRRERLSQSGEGEITQAVVSRMLAIGIQAITAKNLADVVARSRLFDRLLGASFTSFAEDGRLIEQSLTLDDFRLRIGLGTNVTAVPAKAWARRIRIWAPISLSESESLFNASLKKGKMESCSSCRPAS